MPAKAAEPASGAASGPAAALADAHLLSRFQALDHFLLQHQALWRPRPFTERQLPWETEHPALAQWLRQRTLSDAEAW